MYLLDSGVFIQAHRFHYGFDICPGFWNWLIRQHHDGIVFSIEKVKEELLQNDKIDDLHAWAKKIPEAFFVPATAATDPSFRRVSNFLYLPTGSQVRYKHTPITAFMAGADYFLVAQALELKAAGVTHEGAPKEQVSTKEIKIPYVCRELGIRCINTFEMLKEQGARFVEGPLNEP